MRAQRDAWLSSMLSSHATSFVTSRCQSRDSVERILYYSIRIDNDMIEISACVVYSLYVYLRSDLRLITLQDNSQYPLCDHSPLRAPLQFAMHRLVTQRIFSKKVRRLREISRRFTSVLSPARPRDLSARLAVLISSSRRSASSSAAAGSHAVK